ncbi:4-O-methyl-glucuronoyl methylesterase [Trichoderma longibrachiatum]|uniref:(4-O-methyl)-D-glucuronate--lignin esterase n=1 Tax=Trichoderma longibrachiatum ATCC 18648 TaxID=983965 RepID=A0A2T4C0D3_TRILO|nr:carbohydrate esterase family 15 protein [Trichoderma longibrachiatum ATCC 18648]
MASRLFGLLLLAIPIQAQSPVWGQCGGIGWSGPTTCVGGATCVSYSPYYSQCIPSSQASSTIASTTLVTSFTSTSATRTSASTPPASSTGAGGATCSALPGSITLRANAKLNDLFTMFNGDKVTTKDKFSCRQAEMSQLIQRYELGTLPGRPSTVTASLSGNTLTINCGDAGKSISFTVTITYPSSGTAPYPAIIAYGGGSLPAPAGVAMINFNNDDIAAQVNTGSRGQGKFYDLYGKSHSAGAMTAWAWGVSRVIDALELVPGARIDTTRIGVTGCSRNGKGAMVAGAFENRIVLTLPQESGAGGSACWRISDYLKSQGANIQTASEIIGEDPWFSTTFNSYVNQVPVLPFDHHSLAALIAPRGLFVIDNNIDWLGPQSCFGCMTAAHMAWQALGASDHMGYSQIGAHGHCAFPSNQQSQLTAFAQKFLLGQSTNTAIFQSDFSANQSQWIDWTVPTLT